MKYNKIVLFTFLCFSFLLPSFNTNTNMVIAHSDSEVLIYTPIVETLDLKVDGSSTVFVNISYAFSYVARIIWQFEFFDLLINWEGFDSGSALSNGINVFYNDISVIGQVIKTNAGFSRSSYDVSLQRDDRNPNANILSSRYSFDKFIPGGLQITDTKTLSFQIMDDLLTRSAIIQFQVTAEGYQVHSQINTNTEKINDPLNFFETLWYENQTALISLSILSLSALLVLLFFRRR